MKAVDDVSLDLTRARSLGLVGESRQRQDDARTDAARPRPRDRGSDRASTAARSRDLSRARAAQDPAEVQIVFQDPHASLNPAMTIERVGRCTHCGSTGSRRASSCDAARRRGSDDRRARPAGAVHGQVPVGPLGGQKQRAVIARAIILNPVAARRRRARLDARHERARQDPRADAVPQARARPHLPLHHARPGDARSSSATASRLSISAGSSRSVPPT